MLIILGSIIYIVHDDLHNGFLLQKRINSKISKADKRDTRY